MNTAHDKKAKLDLHLHRQALHHVRKIDPGMTVACDHGIIWLTESNNMQDYMLRPGKSVIISKRGDVLIQALSDADVSIIYPN